MRRETLYLRDILEAIGHIEAFLAGATQESFRQSEMMRSAVVQKLAIIGEAAGRSPPELKERHEEIPWAQIVAFRNILIHAYFGTDWDPELDAQPFGHTRLLRRGDVHLPEAGAAQGDARQRAPLSTRRKPDRRRIHPSARSLLGRIQRLALHHVGTLRGRAVNVWRRSQPAFPRSHLRQAVRKAQERIGEAAWF